MTQCDVDDPIACTEQFVYGLNVTVKDANSNSVITEGITVIARDEDYEEELMHIESFDNFIGAGERPGNYIIEINGPNYQSFTSDVIFVDADQCHVIAEVVEFLLQPN